MKVRAPSPSTWRILFFGGHRFRCLTPVSVMLMLMVVVEREKGEIYVLLENR